MSAASRSLYFSGTPREIKNVHDCETNVHYCIDKKNLYFEVDAKMKMKKIEKRWGAWVRMSSARRSLYFWGTHRKKIRRGSRNLCGISIYMCINMYVYTYTPVLVYLRHMWYICMHMYVYTYMQRYTWMYVHIYIHIYMYIYIYIYIYI